MIAVALISAAALAYEILLMRLFSIILWHHFAYMIINLALRGHGAGGALLTMAQTVVHRHYAAPFTTAAAAVGISAIAVAQRMPFNPLEILWDPHPFLDLVAIDLLLALPFLCAGACVCMTFSRWRGMPGRIYSFDILGGAAGSLGIVGLLFVVTPQDALRAIGALGGLAAAVAWLQCGGPRRWPLVLLLALAAAPCCCRMTGPRRRCHRTRSCRRPCTFPRPASSSSASARWAWSGVVGSPRVPLRHAPD